MPGFNRDVLVFVNGLITDGMFRDSNPKGWCHKYIPPSVFPSKNRGVTHWMPLPEPPEALKKGEKVGKEIEE